MSSVELCAYRGVQVYTNSPVFVITVSFYLYSLDGAFDNENRVISIQFN